MRVDRKLIIGALIGFALGYFPSCGQAVGSGGATAIELFGGPGGVRCFAIVDNVGRAVGGNCQ